MTPLVGIPIKPFGVAKARLAPVLDAPDRARLGMAVAAHTAAAVAGSGAVPHVVTGDAAVAAWATDHGWDVVAEPPGGGLDGAAAALVAAAGGGPWALVHADLPTIAPEDLGAMWDALDHGPVIAPSRDGGTSVLAATATTSFAYGHLSFHRHLAHLPGATVVNRPGLALDLDEPEDLERALARPGGAWLEDVLRTTYYVLRKAPPTLPPDG